MVMYGQAAEPVSKFTIHKHHCAPEPISAATAIGSSDANQCRSRSLRSRSWRNVR
jgi:hypothetical protein